MSDYIGVFEQLIFKGTKKQKEIYEDLLQYKNNEDFQKVGFKDCTKECFQNSSWHGIEALLLELTQPLQT